MRYVPVGGRMELRAGKPEAPGEVGCRPPVADRAADGKATGSMPSATHC
jgi:hypothetical protein